MTIYILNARQQNTVLNEYCYTTIAPQLKRKKMNYLEHKRKIKTK